MGEQNLDRLLFDPETSIVEVSGKVVDDFPHDLYIPPDALQVVLESFSGPLDLLLYLIRKQNIDILDIPISSITKQYMEYVELMRVFNLELAAEYLVMAAMLAEIKSRVVLPRAPKPDDEEDPRAELARRLEEYEKFKQAAFELDGLALIGRDVFQVTVEPPPLNKTRPQVWEIQELALAFARVLKRAQARKSHHVEFESLSVRKRMTAVLTRLRISKSLKFSELFAVEEGKNGVVVSFLAVLELLKERLISIIQNKPFSEIYINYSGEN